MAPKTRGGITYLRERLDLFSLLPKSGCIGAEVGVWRGDFARKVLNTHRHISKYYLVDSWCKIGGEYSKDSIDDQNHEENLQRTVENVAQHLMTGRAEAIKGFSA